VADRHGGRAPASAIEEEALERAARAAAEADLAVVVLDGSEAEPKGLERLRDALAGRPRLLVVNKADLPLRDWARTMPEALVVSAASGQGLDLLQEKIVAALVGDWRWGAGMPVVFTERQATLVGRALEAVSGGAIEAAQELVSKIIG